MKLFSSTSNSTSKITAGRKECLHLYVNLVQNYADNEFGAAGFKVSCGQQARQWFEQKRILLTAMLLILLNRRARYISKRAKYATVTFIGL